MDVQFTKDRLSSNSIPGNNRERTARIGRIVWQLYASHQLPFYWVHRGSRRNHDNGFRQQRRFAVCVMYVLPVGRVGGGGDYTVPASAKNMRYIITRRRFTNTEILDLCSNVSSFQLKTRVCPFVSSNARSLRPLMWNIDHRKHEKTLKEWRENISSDHNTFQRNHRNSFTVTFYLIRTSSPGTAKMYNTACPSIIFSWKVPGKYQYGQSD